MMVPQPSCWFGNVFLGKRRLIGHDQQHTPEHRNFVMSAGIFISYRRDESRHAAGRLAEDLSQIFGAEHIFRDIEGIELGVEFAKSLEKALSACSVMLVLIGPQWLEMPDRKRGGRRLDQADDWIRQEIATALKRDVRVVPVLLEGATLPDANELPADIRLLAGRQAMELSDVRWRGDLKRLADALAKLPGFEVGRKVETGGPNRKKLWWGVGLAVLAAGAVQSMLDTSRPNPQPVLPVQQGLPSGYGMQPCNCQNINPVPFAPEARCASGQVRMNVCANWCPNGQPPVAYVCM